MRDPHSSVTNRWLLFYGWIAFSSLLFIKPLAALLRLSLSQDDSSYLPLIPFFSASVIWLDRQRIFEKLSNDKILSAMLALLSGSAALASFFPGTSSSSGLSLAARILSLGLLWAAGFALSFGKAAVQEARFPLLFLLLMVPLPGFLLERIISLLQEGSAWITGAFFDLFGVPALREGLVFHLSRANIEVARECSGIRSSMALLIIALLISHFRLKNFWAQFSFVICGLLMMIVKNGIRIATLTLLAMYVDPGFLFGRLHHQGGVVFFVLALLLLLPLLFALERMESKGTPIPALPSSLGGS